MAAAAGIVSLIFTDSFTTSAGAAENAPPLNYFDRTVFVRSEVLPDRPYDENRKVETHSASGFFVSFERQIVFVTAKHVARETMPETQFCFLTAGGDSHFARLGGLVADVKNPWQMHPKADLAIFVVTFSPKLEKGIEEEIRALALPFSAISTKEAIRASRVTVCGFPIELGTFRRISPLAMTAYVASRELDLPADGEPTSMFLITPAIGAGCSGGPVFLTTDRGEADVLLGIYITTYFDASGGKLSSVVPARQIIELITENVGSKKDKR
jgi:hypothetical protein